MTATGSRSFETRVVDRREHPHPGVAIEDRIAQLCRRRAVEDVAAVLTCLVIVLAGSDGREMPLHNQDVEHETGARVRRRRRPCEGIIRERPATSAARST